MRLLCVPQFAREATRRLSVDSRTCGLIASISDVSRDRCSNTLAVRIKRDQQMTPGQVDTLAANRLTTTDARCVTHSERRSDRRTDRRLLPLYYTDHALQHSGASRCIAPHRLKPSE